MSKPEGLFSTFEIKGEFWKASAPELKLPGTLKFSPEKGTELELYGMFPNEHFNQGVIHGFAGGQLCTLNKCYHHGSEGHLTMHGNQRFSRFSALHLFLGAQFDPTQARFKSMRVHLTNIENWYMHVPFHLGPDETKGATATFTPYECPEADVPAINAKVAFDYLATIGGGDTTQMVWEAQLHLKIKPAQPMPFFDYFDEHRRTLEHLISLLIGAPVYQSAILLKLDGTNVHESVKFFADSSVRRKGGELHFPQMLTTFPQIKDHWPAIVQKWFASAEKLDSPMRLFFGARYLPTSVELDFIRVMQSIESYHRLTNPGKFMPQAEYMEKIGSPTIASIPASTDPDLKKSISKRIELANELTFRKRLKLIFASAPTELIKLVKFHKTDFTIEQLINNRNWFTHFPPELKQYALDTLELWPLKAGVEVILEYLFLKEAGVPEEVFLKNLLQRRHFLFNQPD